MLKKIDNFLKKPNIKIESSRKVLSYLILIIGIILFIRYQIRLLNLVEWGDESETIVVTKMMAAGYRLYSEVYNNHGPLVFLPGFLISKMGEFGIPTYRIPILILQLLALFSIYKSPIFINKTFRNYFVVIASTIMIIFFSNIYGHAYLYQVISGLLFIIVLNQYSLPNILDIKLSSVKVVFLTFILFSIPFLAVTNVPMVGLLLISSFRLRDLKYIVVGALLAFIFNLGFIYLFGSWDGYVAYHFYMNFKVLNNSAGIMSYVYTIFNYYTTNFLHFMSICILLILVYKLNKHVKIVDYWRSLLFIPMLMSLVIRGGEMFSLSGLIYLYTLLGLTSVLFISEYEYDTFYGIFNDIPVIIFSLLCLIILYLPIRDENFYYAFPKYSEFSRIAKKITNNDEKVLALTFRSYEYILSERLPASTHFIYLSIQAKYNQIPYKNVYVSIVDDVMNNRPKIILVDRWNIIVDETDEWDYYANDLMTVIYANYYQLRDSDIFIRNDVNLLDYGLDPAYGYEIQ